MNKLLLNKEIYTEKFIDFAKQAYIGLAVITHQQDDNHHVLYFDDCIYNENLTVREFENYIIDMMVSKNDK